MNIFIEWLQGWTQNGKVAIVFFPFLLLALLTASLKIVKYSEVIISKSKLGSSFFGGAIIALITSLPELITEITQANAGTPENGLGDDIGSNAFSIFLIAVGAFVCYKYLFLNKLGKWTKVSIVLSFIVTSVLTLYLSFGIEKDIVLGTIGLMPLSIFIMYLIVLLLSYKYGDDDEEVKLNKDLKGCSLKKGILWFVFWAVLVVLFSVLINIDVSAFQRGFSMKTHSVGGIFLAMTTSLPEVVAFFSFLKIKKPAAAIASLVGSHFLNMAITFFGDITYTKGPSFNHIDMQEHQNLAFMCLGMIGLLIIQLGLSKLFPKHMKKRVFYLIIPTIIIISYVTGWILMLTN